MAPPPFGFEQAPHEYFNQFAQEAADKMGAEAEFEKMQEQGQQAEMAEAEKKKQEHRDLRAAKEFPDVPDGTKWIEFEEAFNQEFASVLHIFGPEDQLLDAGPADKHAKSGNDVSATKLRELFSIQQREILSNYFETHQIPERLFNGNDQGKLNAQQRILLSSHILVNGTYTPGDFEQRVHAMNCGHWAQVVQNYAGVTANNGVNTDSINGSFDIFGNVVAGGVFDRPIGKKEEKVRMSNLNYQEDLETGPFDPDTKHFGRVEQFNEDMAKYLVEKAAYDEQQKNKPQGKKSKKGKKDEAPQKPDEPFRDKQLPLEDFNIVQPGDWLYIYNANGAGNHSVIFSRWAGPFEELNPNEKQDPLMSTVESETEEPMESAPIKNPHEVKFRRAITFDESKPDAGGQAHAVNLGNQLYRKGDFRVSPITKIAKVNPAARPALVLSELFPEASNEKAVALENDSYIAQIEEKYNVTKQQLMQWMREDNAKRIKDLGDRLSKEQAQMLQDGNLTDNFETLVRISSRLRQWSENAAILHRNEEKQYTRKNAQFAEVEEEFETLKATVENRAKPVLEEIAQLEKDLAAAEEKLAQAGLKKSEIERRNKDVDKIEAKIRRRKERLAKILKPYYSMYGSLPYGQVALGNKEGENKSNQSAKDNGKLQHLMTMEKIAERLDEERGKEHTN